MKFRKSKRKIIKVKSLAKLPLWIKWIWVIGCVLLGRKIPTLGFVLFHRSRVLLSLSSSILLSWVEQHRVHMRPQFVFPSSVTIKFYLVPNE